ncbi:hypothetical protein [Geothermobacter hydrogeniphilus]|uniref:Lipoprotein n=1 Tax=Geothermobacter hydrogeniphilus TaxID=1969733 RepID=A0A1X0XLI9_9BACT|nr:hypothetical protein [Geothermobacter hydrogeniphilus]ORJ53721.1 hypothetical protein B5V00_16100 [Geothermobacter hydrogeniphilus]
MRNLLKRSCFCLCLLAATCLPTAAESVQENARFNVNKGDQGQAPRESLLDLTFGSPRKLATERGILIIDAFFDADGDKQHGPDEDTLSGEIKCTLDDIDYSIPAFIPGLDYQETYELSCQGNRYIPEVNEDLVFIRKRGQVIQVDLPCRLRTAADENPDRKDAASGANRKTAVN